MNDKWCLDVNDDAGTNEWFMFENRPNLDEIEATIQEWVESGDWGTDGASLCCRWRLYNKFGREMDADWHTVEIPSSDKSI